MNHAMVIRRISSCALTVPCVYFTTNKFTRNKFGSHMLIVFQMHEA